MTDNSPIIKIKNLSVRFHHGHEYLDAVTNISLTVDKGSIHALVGESGSGKSVTAHSISRLLPSTASHPCGEILFEDQSILQLKKSDMQKVLGNDIGIIFQEPMTSLNPLHTVEKQISEILFIHKGLSNTHAQKKTIELLELVKIREPKDKLSAYPHELSGGQRQRVMIAMALANEPKLLIADEPTTALDVTIQKQILELLKELQNKLGMSILLITHDLGIVKNYCDTVSVMKDGAIVECQKTADLFSNPTHHYTKLLLQSEPSGAPVKQAINNDEKPLLSAQNLKVWFPIKRGVFQQTVGHVKAVDDISFDLMPGKTLGVVGESGSGKTTLGLALLNLLESKGKVCLNGAQINHLSQKEFRPLRKNMQIVFQDPFGSLSPRLSVKQVVSEGLIAQNPGLSIDEAGEQVLSALIEVGLDESHLNRFPHEFSGGQRQRISIARALILKPKIIILDEPTSALDRSIQSQILDLLKKLQEQHNLSYLFISHDLKVVKAICHEVLVMQSGKIVEFGPADKLFHSPQHRYTQTLLSAAFLDETATQRG